MKQFQLLILIFLVFVLNGCTTVQVDSGATDSREKNKLWEMRKQKLNGISTWQLSGRSSVAYRGESWPFGLQWKQAKPQQFDVVILHPLTRNRIGLLKKTSGRVSFTSDKGKVYRDSSAEVLLQKHLNVKIPVEGMQYWVRGLTAPQYPVESYKLDGFGRPLLIKQAGWSVSYSSYEGRAYDSLPERLTISRNKPESLQVKMRIKSWVR